MQMALAKILQFGRRLGAALVFVLLTLFFVLPGEFFPAAAQLAAKLQVVPALLAGAWLVPALLALATLAFGRIYCSIICPLGMLQDLLGRLYPKKHRSRLRFRPSSRWLRPGVGIFFLAALILGNTVLVSLLEPYSMYGIMAVHLFKQGWASLNNIFAAAWAFSDNFTAIFNNLAFINTIFGNNNNVRCELFNISHKNNTPIF